MAGASVDIKEAGPSSLPTVRCRSGSLPSLRSEMACLTVTGQGVTESPLMKKRGSTPHLPAGDADATQSPEDASAMGEEWLKFLEQAKQTASWTAELRKRTTQWHRMFNSRYRPKPRADDSLGLYGQALWSGEPTHDNKQRGRLSKTPSPSKSYEQPTHKKSREATSTRQTSPSHDHGKRGRDPKKSPGSSQRDSKPTPKKSRAFATSPSRSLEVKGSPLPLPVKRSQSHTGEGSGVPVVVVDPAPAELRMDDTDNSSSA
ncbi:hypothetical protein Bbelb_168530 [Branchiostoma belcheri]|nr:hypothetical protein Bbelb_168530 [Branchiostoma belcheri]